MYNNQACWSVLIRFVPNSLPNLYGGFINSFIYNAFELYSYSDWGFSTLTEVFLNLTEVFLTLTEVFLCLFLSCKANARVKLPKMGHGPHSSTLVCICVVRLLLVLFYVLFVCKCVLPPCDNPIAVNKYIITRFCLKVFSQQIFRQLWHSEKKY